MGGALVMATGDGGIYEFIEAARDGTADSEELREARKLSNDERATRAWQAESKTTATRSGKEWTETEIEILRMGHMTMREQARALGRTYQSVKSARAKFRREGVL